MILEAVAGLNSLLNLVPLPDRLTIIPLTEVGPVPIPAGEPYVAMFNPENFPVNEQYEYATRRIDGIREPQPYFKHIKAQEFNFDLLVDGTGASGESRNCSDDIEKFKRTVGFNGAIHRPNLLVVVWGKFIRTCILTNMDVEYSLFKKDGTPLRAKIKVKFREHVPILENLLKLNLQSPDLTHRRTAVEGDTLWRMCYRIYGDARFYLEAARVNNMTTFRQLKPGTELNFPQLER